MKNTHLPKAYGKSPLAILNPTTMNSLLFKDVHMPKLSKHNVIISNK